MLGQVAPWALPPAYNTHFSTLKHNSGLEFHFFRHFCNVYFAEQVVWTAEIDFKGKSITLFPNAEATFGHLLAFAALTSTLSYTFKLFTTRKAWSG